MTKQRIIAEIRRIAQETGHAPGRQAFEGRTGVKLGEWYPHLWLRWSEALAEAGLEPNARQQKLDDRTVIEKYAGLIRELGRIPVQGEIRRKARQDAGFPSHTIFGRFGAKRDLVRSTVKYLKESGGYDEVVAACEVYLATPPPSGPGLQNPPGSQKTETGFVYLMKSGTHFKIGRTNSIGRRGAELAIQIPVPPKTIHSIETDDPAGVEAYWHRRFADRRGNGEWFRLTPEDVAAFKLWRKIV